MSGTTPRSTKVVVTKGRANVTHVARAALEMTATCYVWLEKSDTGVAVTLTQSAPGKTTAAEIQATFDAELQRLLDLDRLEQRTRLVRSAVVGQAFAPTPVRAQQPIPPAPALDPETEAEIEKLLAEIESDDWLDDAGDIAKTWEERFGSESKDGGGKEGTS